MWYNIGVVTSVIIQYPYQDILMLKVFIHQLDEPLHVDLVILVPYYLKRQMSSEYYVYELQEPDSLC